MKKVFFILLFCALIQGCKNQVGPTLTEDVIICSYNIQVGDTIIIASPINHPEQVYSQVFLGILPGWQGIKEEITYHRDYNYVNDNVFDVISVKRIL